MMIGGVVSEFETCSSREMPPFEFPTVHVQQVYPRLDAETFVRLRNFNPEFQDLFRTTILSRQRDDVEELLELTLERRDIEAFRFILSNSDVDEETLDELTSQALNQHEEDLESLLAIRAIFDFIPGNVDVSFDFLETLVPVVVEYPDVLYSSFVEMAEAVDMLEWEMLSNLYESAVDKGSIDIVFDIVKVRDSTRSVFTSAEIADRTYVGRYYLPALVQRRTEILDFLTSNCISIEGSEDVVASILGFDLPSCVYE